MKAVRFLEYGVSAVRPVSQEVAAMHGASGVMMRLTPSGELHGKIGRLLEEGALKADVATVHALRMLPKPGKPSSGTCQRFHGLTPGSLPAARRKSHGKIALRIA